MKKEKLYDIEKDEQKKIDAFRCAVDDALSAGLYGCTCRYDDTHTKAGYRIDAVLDYGAYTARLFYNPCYLLCDFLDVELELGGRYRYSIYDVFNLLGIDDFDQYYYSSIGSEDDFPAYVKSILDMLQKYDYDIKKATDPANIISLDANVEDDYRRTYSKDKEESWRDDMDDPLRLNIVHPYFTAASSATDSDKLLKKLQKAASKDKLGTLYERRLLAHLEQGHTVVNSNLVEQKTRDKRFLKLKLTVDAIIVALVAIVFIIIGLLNKYINFTGAYVPQAVATIFGRRLPVDPERAMAFFVTVIPLSFGLIGFLTKPIIKRLSGDDADVMRSYDRDQQENVGTGTWSKIFSTFIRAAAIVVGLGFGLFAFNNSIGFYDDYVRFNTGILFTTTDISYSDVNVARIMGEYDDDDNYVLYDDTVCYAIYNDDNVYYELDSLDPDGNTTHRIDDIISRYDKQVKEYKDTEAFIEAMGK